MTSNYPPVNSRFAGKRRLAVDNAGKCRLPATVDKVYKWRYRQKTTCLQMATYFPAVVDMSSNLPAVVDMSSNLLAIVDASTLTFHIDS